MHTLSRQVRFSLDPFADRQTQGFNSYASKPCGDGLSLYLSLWVDLASELNPETGFVVNVSEIDRVVRADVVPLFSDAIGAAFRSGQTPTFISLAALLKKSWAVIDDSFPANRLARLRLDVNPYKQITIRTGEANMFIYSEKFEFSAMHQLWNDRFDDKANVELFGKCANPAGHGHNYILEVSVEKSADPEDPAWHADFEKDVKENFLDRVDHKNLNVDVAEFKSLNPTVENLSFLAWQKLENKLKNAKLYNITVWENDRTYCSYTGS